MPEATEDTLGGASDSTGLEQTIAALASSRTASPTLERSDGGLEPGTLIGRYVVLAKLGAGAMGVVFAAYDPELDRKVALKLLKTGKHEQAAARTRLQREAQALAKLGHPNVVAVHDVGVHEGQLFLAMEFVAGQTLRTWMRAGDQPRPWREVLRVFEQAGRGLAAAHEAGLIHRDFKPDNVMLGDDGRVRVMDFGLARAGADDSDEQVPTRPIEALELESSKPQVLSHALTQTGTLLGTPAYMAPEQFEGRPADARADQFGFCVTLYEALYGQRPFAGDSIAALFFAAGQGRIEAAPRGSAVPAWVRKLVVRGLAPAPDQRHASMQLLLDALGRDPVLRRRRWVAAASVLALLGGAGIGLGYSIGDDAPACSGMADRLDGVWDREARAAVREAIASTELSYAAATLERVERRLDDYTERWVAQRTETCMATQRGEQSSELLDLEMACLDERLQHVAAAVDVLREADAGIVEQAVQLVGNLPQLERCDDAEVLLAEQPPPEDPELAAQVEQLDQQLIAAWAKQSAGEYEAALALADAVVAAAEPLDHPPLLARAWLRQGHLQTKTGDYETGEATLIKAYDAALGLRMLDEAAYAAIRLVVSLGYEFDASERGRRWIVHAEPLVRASGNPMRRSQLLTGLGLLAFADKDHATARDHFERALEIDLQLYGPDDEALAVDWLNLGNVALAEGERVRARECFERSLAIKEAALGPEHPSVAFTLNSLGRAALGEQRFDEARTHYERALALRERALGPMHLDVASSLTSLASLESAEGNHERSLALIERALVIRETVLGPDHVDVAALLNDLATGLARLGRHEAARERFVRALAIIEQAKGPEHFEVAVVMNNLGTILNNTGRPAEARAYFERVLAILEAKLGSEHPMLLAPIGNLGTTAKMLGEFDVARVHFERTLALSERIHGPDHVELVLPLVGIAGLELEQGQLARARAHYERARELLLAAHGPEHADLVFPLTGLGQVAIEQGKFDEALSELERALTLHQSNASDPIDLAETQFALARALWSVRGERRDRARARELAEAARTTYANASITGAKQLARVDAWLVKNELAKHPK